MDWKLTTSSNVKRDPACICISKKTKQNKTCRNIETKSLTFLFLLFKTCVCLVLMLWQYLVAQKWMCCDWTLQWLMADLRTFSITFCFQHWHSTTRSSSCLAKQYRKVTATDSITSTKPCQWKSWPVEFSLDPWQDISGRSLPPTTNLISSFPFLLPFFFVFPAQLILTQWPTWGILSSQLRQ